MLLTNNCFKVNNVLSWKIFQAEVLHWYIYNRNLKKYIIWNCNKKLIQSEDKKGDTIIEFYYLKHLRVCFLFFLLMQNISCCRPQAFFFHWNISKWEQLKTSVLKILILTVHSLKMFWIVHHSFSIKLLFIRLNSIIYINHTIHLARTFHAEKHFTN